MTKPRLLWKLLRRGVSSSVRRVRDIGTVVKTVELPAVKQAQRRRRKLARRTLGRPTAFSSRPFRNCGIGAIRFVRSQAD